MPWSKIDDQFYDHPKIVAAGPLGIALFVCGLSYCSRHLTDGFIATAQVRRLIDIDNPEDVAEKLIAVGLWERRDGGYQVHDYLEYNPSRARVEATRLARAEAGHEGGLRSGEARRKQTAEEMEANGKQTPSKMPSKTEARRKQKRTPSPSPSPNPSPDSPEDPPTAGASAPPTPPPRKHKQTARKSKPPLPEAVKVFQENAHRYPAKSWYTDVAETVGEESADLEFWGRVVKAYVGLGWNPTNVKNMLDFYQRREVPPGNKGEQPHAGIVEWLDAQGIEVEVQ